MLYILSLLFGGFFGMFCYKYPFIGKIALGTQIGLIIGLTLYSLGFYMIETTPTNVIL